MREIRFYLAFGFSRFKVANKRTMNLFKGNEDSDSRILSGWIEKYKPALSKVMLPEVSNSFVSCEYM